MGTGLSAVLLAAGRSTRMGREKALLEVERMPLWRRQRDLLRSAGATELFLSVRPEQSWAAQADGFDAKLHDAFPDCGPIVGITAALERMSHERLLVLAIDLPALPAEWFGSLLQGAPTGIGVVGRREEFFEPLAAVYPREMRWLAWETIARGEYSLQRLLAAALGRGLLVARDISRTEAAWFQNWNEPT